jgi:hypothetical protein
MRRMIVMSLAGMLLATGASLLAEDFWAKKDYMQWSDDEVKKLMTNSPWAKDITVAAPLGAIGGRGQRPAGAASAATPVDVEGTGGGGGGGGRGRGGRGGGGGGAAGEGGGTQALLTLNISWRSALPLRKALVRSRLGAGAADIPQGAQELMTKDQDEYVIVVTGVPAGLARVMQNPELLEKSTLRAGKKPPLAAKSIDIQKRTQSLDLIYVFSKTQPITAEDKEVEVVLKLGQIDAKKKFSLKDMVYSGKLEL